MTNFEHIQKKRTLEISTGTILATTFLLIVIGIFSIIWQKPWQAGASVAVGSQYQSTTTPQLADLTNLCPKMGSNLGNVGSSTTGVLGSIVITGANVGSLHLYDATTSNEALRTPPVATSTLLLAELPTLVTGNATTSKAIGTLSLDIEFKRGLLVDYTTNVATTTITYRCEG